MLVPKRILERIPSGEITLVFRRWKRPTVRSGGRLRTSIGELAIVSVEPYSIEQVTEEDARASGSSDADDLRRYLSRDREGEIYRIEVAFAGPDSRTALQERTTLDASELEEIASRLARLDRASSSGPWTERYLRLIAERPDVLALELAESIGMERLAFKANVRKLKELGLTESRRQRAGYRLSPCGKAYLESLDGPKKRKRRSRAGRNDRATEGP
jgi:hypothetical protein